MTIPTRSGPLGALALASVIWGTADVAGKVAMSGIPPLTLATLRFGVALVVLSLISRRQSAPRAPARIVAPLGLLGVALTFMLQNLGLDRTSAANASMVQGVVPVLTVILATTFLGERLSAKRFASVAAAMTGVSVVTLVSGEGIQAPGLGDALVFASTGCFATFIIVGRQVFPVYGTLAVLTGMTTWGALIMLPAALLELRTAESLAMGLNEIALVLYLGVGCSALTYGLWGYALCHLDASQAAMFDALIPVVGIVTAVWVLREAPAGLQLAGGSLIVIAVWLTVSDRDIPPEETIRTRCQLRAREQSTWP